MHIIDVAINEVYGNYYIGSTLNPQTKCSLPHWSPHNILNHSNAPRSPHSEPTLLLPTHPHFSCLQLSRRKKKKLSVPGLDRSHAHEACAAHTYMFTLLAPTSLPLLSSQQQCCFPSNSSFSWCNRLPPPEGALVISFLSSILKLSDYSLLISSFWHPLDACKHAHISPS